MGSTDIIPDDDSGLSGRDDRLYTSNDPNDPTETTSVANIRLAQSVQALEAELNSQKIKVTKFAGNFLIWFGWIIILLGAVLGVARVIDLSWWYRGKVRYLCLERCTSVESTAISSDQTFDFEKCIDGCVDAMEEIGYGFLHDDARTVIDALLGIIVLTVLFRLTNYFLGKDLSNGAQE